MKAFLNQYQAYVAGGVIATLVIIISLQNFFLSDLGYTSHFHSFYNNYLIFKNSFFHLNSGSNLYVAYPDVQQDLFKYSPTFALFFGLFAYLPDLMGLIIWNALNALVFYAIWQLKLPKLTNKLWIMGFILIEFLTNIQSSQSNGLMAGLMILGFVFLERKNLALATLMIVLSAYIKIFGVLTFALFLMYPDKLKAIGYTLFWTLILFFLPLINISFSSLLQQYENWGILLQADQPVDFSLSVNGWLKYWFSFQPKNLYIVGLGAFFFVIPYIRQVQYRNLIFRNFMLASVLIWVVIFNHKAESPTFILAVSGVAIWYFTQRSSLVNKILMVLVLLFTQLAPTDLYPSYVRENFFIPYVVKVFPIILVWLKVQRDAFALDGCYKNESSGVAQ